MPRIMPDHGGAGDGIRRQRDGFIQALVIPRWLASAYDLL